MGIEVRAVCDACDQQSIIDASRVQGVVVYCVDPPEGWVRGERIGADGRVFICPDCWGWLLEQGGKGKL